MYHFDKSQKGFCECKIFLSFSTNFLRNIGTFCQTYRLVGITCIYKQSGLVFYATLYRTSKFIINGTFRKEMKCSAGILRYGTDWFTILHKLVHAFLIFVLYHELIRVASRNPAILHFLSNSVLITLPITLLGATISVLSTLRES